MPGTPKQFNTHRFPNATRQPRHLDRLRKEEALKRQAAYALLTVEQKLAKLPPTGAVKQRAKLQAMLLKQQASVVQDKAANTAPVMAAALPEEEITMEKKLSKKEQKAVK